VSLIALALERAALRAWPGRVRETRSGWVLQATDGFSQRANAVWPLAWSSDAPLAEAVREAAAWCEAQGVAPCFKLADGVTHPPGLADALAAQGFAPRMETRVMTLQLMGRQGFCPSEHIVPLGAPTPGFWQPIYEAAPSEADFAERRDIVSRIAEPCGYALAELDGRPAAVGLGVLCGGFLGLYLMRTAPWARRQGLARAIMDALLHWGAAHEATLAYLQVEESNAAAIALYENAGFTTFYRYRYWIRH
jgi:N-acetylglutamate synthase